MKATVVQIEGKFAVLLQQDGSFIKAKAMNLKIGDVVNKKEMHVCGKRKFGSIVAAALFIITMGTGVYTYGATSYQVSLDVNPGIMMEVNLFERVIALEAANEDAQEVLEGLELKNKDIDEAISEVVGRISDLGYFDEESGNILIAATGRNMKNAEHAAEKLGSTVEIEMAEKEIDAEVTVGVVGYEMVEAARQIEGMTPGKYNLIVNLLKVAPEEAAGYNETSIKDIMKMFTESKRIEKKNKPEKVSENEQNTEDKKKEPVDKEFKEEDESELPVQAGLKEKNAPIDTPASNKKAPNADAMKKNSEKRQENPSKPKKPAIEEKTEIHEEPGRNEKPKMPEIDEREEKPETPADNETETGRP